MLESIHLLSSVEVCNIAICIGFRLTEEYMIRNVTLLEEAVCSQLFSFHFLNFFTTYFC